MTTILRWLLALAIGMLLSFSDYDVEARENVNCYDYMTQEDLYIDSETEFWYMRVDLWVIETPTDLVLMQFGNCVLELITQIESLGKTGYVVLTNDGWIPSRVRTIDRQTAEAMADYDIADAEYGFDMEESAWLAGNKFNERTD